MNNAVEVHFLYENGSSFDDIAKVFNISPKEAAQLYVSAKIAEDKFKNKEPVVYRKRHIVKPKPAKKAKQKTLKHFTHGRPATKDQLTAFMKLAKERGWNV